MATRRGRSRHQTGWVEETPARKWEAHWYEYITDPVTGKEHRKHRSKVVGEKAKMRKFEAEEELRKEVAKVNPLTSTVARRRDGGYTLAWFIKERWQPMYEGRWKQSTRDRNEDYFNQIRKEFGEVALSEIDGVKLQAWLNGLAAEYSRSVVKNVRLYLKSMLEEAVEQDFLIKNPARKLKLPITRKPDKTVMEWATLRKVLEKLDGMNRLIVKVACGEGVRPSELFAFRWKSLLKLPTGKRVLEITETVYEHELRPWAKTEGSEDIIALPDRLADELEAWRLESEYPGDKDFIFPNSAGGYIDVHNFYNRVLFPIRDAMGLPKLNFQIMRRTFATRAYSDKHGSLKDIQAQLRHEKPDMTLEEYIQSVPETVFEMVNAMYEEIEPNTEVVTKEELKEIPPVTEVKQ